MTSELDEQASAVPASPNMLPCDARALLMNCRHSAQALQDAGVAIETGRIGGEIQAIIYPDTPSRHRGTNAKFKAAYWVRIVSSEQEESFWSSARADLPKTMEAQAVELRGIRLNEADVRGFAAEYGVPDVKPLSTPAIPIPTDDRPTRNLGGRPPKYQAWDGFWMAVVKLAKDGELNDDTFHTQAALVDHLLGVTDESLSKDSIEPKVGRIWRAYVRPIRT